LFPNGLKSVSVIAIFTFENGDVVWYTYRRQDCDKSVNYKLFYSVVSNENLFFNSFKTVKILSQRWLPYFKTNEVLRSRTKWIL